MSALAGGGDPFAQALAQLEAQQPRPPHSYRYRLAALLGFTILLLLSAVTYLLLHVLHARRVGRPVWFLRLQRTSDSRGSRLVTINSLLCFCLFAAVAAGAQIGTRVAEWKWFIQGHLFTDSTLYEFVPWLAVFIQAWVFSATNLQATFAARRRLKSAAMPWQAHAWVHNATLVGIPVLIMAAILPVCVLQNNKQNEVVRASMALVPVLRQASADLAAGRPLDVAALLQLSSAQASLPAADAQRKKLLVVLIAFCYVVAFAIIVMNIYSLFLVMILRKSVKATQERRSMQKAAISFHQDKEISVENGGAEMPSSPAQRYTYPHPTTTIGSPSPPATDSSSTPFQTSRFSGGVQMGQWASRGVAKPNQPAPDANDVALQRLARDLTLAVPAVIAMITVLLCGLSFYLSQANSATMRWSFLEFTLDSFGWVYVAFTNATIWFFTFNLVRAWRQGKVSSHMASTTKVGTATVASDSQQQPQRNQQFSVVLLPTAEEEEKEREGEEDNSDSGAETGQDGVQHAGVACHLSI